MAQGAPGGAMFDIPIEQSLFEANVVTLFFALNPFVAQDFLSLG